MRKLLTLILILCTIAAFAEMRGGSQYDPGAARSNLSNVDAAATPSMTSITLSDKIRAVWADILGDIYASGTVKVSTGTAAAPAYSFASDPDTGIYSAGANSIGFSIGGNVNTLSISGMTLADELDFTLSASNSGHSNRLQWAYGGTPYAWIERINADGGMGFTAQSLERMRITGSGNVLISTSTDDGANKLQVNGTAKATSLYALGGNGNQLYLDNGGERYTQISFLNSGVQKSAIYYDNTNTALSFYTGGAERMALKDSGNVLIATSTDDGANKLQVNGSMRLIGGAAPTATEGAIYFNSTDKHFYGYNGTAWVQLDN